MPSFLITVNNQYGHNLKCGQFSGVSVMESSSWSSISSFIYDQLRLRCACAGTLNGWHWALALAMCNTRTSQTQEPALFRASCFPQATKCFGRPWNVRNWHDRERLIVNTKVPAHYIPVARCVHLLRHLNPLLRLPLLPLLPPPFPLPLGTVLSLKC